MRRILREIARAGTPAAALAELPAFGEFVDFIGLPEVRETEQRYGSEPAPAAAAPAGPVEPGPGFPAGEHAAGHA